MNYEKFFNWWKVLKYVIDLIYFLPLHRLAVLIKC